MPTPGHGRARGWGKDRPHRRKNSRGKECWVGAPRWRWRSVGRSSHASQVTLFTEGYYRRWLGDRPMQNPAVLQWFNLRAAVSKFHLSAMPSWTNLIQHCWGEVMWGGAAWGSEFCSQLTGGKRDESGRGRLRSATDSKTDPPVPEQLGNTRLTRRDPVQITAHSEVVRWAQVSGGGLAKKQCGLVEVVEDGGEWKVARGLVRVRGGGVLLWIANVHPFPRWHPLATIAGLEPSQVQSGCNMALQTPSPGEVVIDVRTTQAPAGAGSPFDPLLQGLGTDEDILIEILASRTNKEIRDIKKAYKEEYKKELEDDIKSDTGGDFRNALLALCKANRSEDTLLNEQLADSDARALYEAGEKRKGTDLSIFIDILTTRSAPQLRKVFERYSKYSKVDVGKAIDLELKGDIESLLTAVVKCAGCKPAFFAEKLYLSMKGSGTRTKVLTRVMVSRSEVDLQRIKDEYKKKYGKTLYQDILSKNVFFSPLSVSVALAALSLGARGKTHQQLFEGLGFNGTDITAEEVNQAFQHIHQDLNEKTDVDLSLGNALFIDKKFKPLPEFLESMKLYYQSEGFNTDFSNVEQATEQINKYVEEKTKGKITKLVEEVDPQTVMYLINYIYFKGKWEIPFDPKNTKEDQFHVDDKTSVPVQMMYEEDKFHIFHDEEISAHVLQLHYNESVSMMLVLPEKALQGLEEGVCKKHLKKWTTSVRKRTYRVYVPKLSLKTSYQLKEILSGMGITEIFKKSANLTGISEQGNFVVSKVIHKATLDMDEAGTTATAVTGIEIMATSIRFPVPVPVLKFDRPFMVFVLNLETRSILFMGKIVNPAEK
ncbi:hypothetical protein SKAU_G00014810 [Synaphobranchus kaupii]|uniref:Annexin n=1 Tax=Synaphobranchus kaupii TaxID=118154 RepID=A0A9Q1GBW7_SYNKA|nr:hypothetical protein SKAU_G00014810 [Synaphobranchus kaupii]